MNKKLLFFPFLSSMSVGQEFSNTKPSEYSDFGLPYSGYWSEQDKDPVNRCLPGAFMSSGFQTAQLGMCPDFMTQRCGKEWDSKCDLYFESLDNINDVRDFLSQTLSKKFCRLAKDSKCTIQCQPFDPIAQKTAQVCTYLGTEPLKDISDNLDVGYYFPVNMSPDYMGKCKQNCDVISPDKIDPKDPVIDKILGVGYRSQVLTQICKLSIDSNTPISNPRLAGYCDRLVKEKEQIVEKFTGKMKASDQAVESFTPPIVKRMIAVIIGLLIVAVGYMVVRKYRMKK
jgi:hypothetical protein